MAFIWQFPATVTRIIDGDSFIADVGWNATQQGNGKDDEVRVEGINALELHDRFGGEARDALAGLLPIGTQITLVHHKREKYGRFLARVIRDDGVDVGAGMLVAIASDGSTHLAVPDP